jgi:hypothetical protein
MSETKYVHLGNVTPDSLWKWITGQQEEPTEAETWMDTDNPSLASFAQASISVIEKNKMNTEEEAGESDIISPPKP